MKNLKPLSIFRPINYKLPLNHDCLPPDSGIVIREKMAE